MHSRTTCSLKRPETLSLVNHDLSRLAKEGRNWARMRQTAFLRGVKLEQGIGKEPVLASLRGMGQWYPDLLVRLCAQH